MRRLAITGLTIAVLLLPCGASAKTVSAFGIKVQRCVVVENANHTQTTGVNVVYYNTHQTPATEVYFFVSYHGTNYTLVDRGTFTYDAQINHTLTNALSGVVWQGDKPDLCTPSRVLFATGKILE
ncbi:MAG TPA: hypothetical protein VGG51_07570 [Candidatus Cybelea sp.]|jgi:hypothetical protein